MKIISIVTPRGCRKGIPYKNQINIIESPLISYYTKA